MKTTLRWMIMGLAAVVLLGCQEKDTRIPLGPEAAESRIKLAVLSWRSAVTLEASAEGRVRSAEHAGDLAVAKMDLEEARVDLEESVERVYQVFREIGEDQPEMEQEWRAWWDEARERSWGIWRRDGRYDEFVEYCKTMPVKHEIVCPDDD